MLVRLNEIDGVAKSFSNYSGTMLKIEMDGRDTERLLSWASSLHEVGLGLAHQQYHKHGEYIVSVSDLFGGGRPDCMATETAL